MEAETISIPTIAELTKGIVPPGDPALAPSLELPADVDIRGWNSDHPIFDELIKLTQPKTIIEVGSWKGRSLMHMAKATADLGTQLYAVDTWLGGVDHHLSKLEHDDRKLDRFGSPRLYHQFIRNFLGADEATRIHPIQQTSLNGARILAAAGISAKLIYIDGSHEYADVYADLLAYGPLLEEGGMMFGDDFRGFPGVFTAVMRFMHEFGMQFKEVGNNYWVLR